MPAPGDNATDAILNGIHFNTAVLRRFNYTYYSNGTLSNASFCWLVFDAYRPRMDINGSVINGTSCYSPIVDIQVHAKLGITFAVLFAASIIITLLNLRKHGKIHLPREKRWPTYSRRLVWCWLVIAGICGVVSGFMSIDVDRYYIQSLPLILQSLFYYLMLPPLLAAVWEDVRHWACWEERQIYDRNPGDLPVETSREDQESWLPVLFYIFAWMNLLLAVPRSWTAIQLQRSPEQQETGARPTATDARFKSAAFMALCALLVICYSLGHSIYRYRLGVRRYDIIGGILHGIRVLPVKYKLIITTLAVKVVYTIAFAYDWTISPFKYNAHAGWVFGVGYFPVLLIMVIFNIFGFAEPNEDHARRRRPSGPPCHGHRRKSGWWKTARVEYRDYSLDNERLENSAAIGTRQLDVDVELLATVKAGRDSNTRAVSAIEEHS
ncbi:hypothetical protein BGW36DRAFT_399787 [Talaromyces proteolyticus]|uniref:Uncharacterized protein n=1 Tax=Talaromyces proteolyticus TaxID=1131652 RepID=A0AAD4KKE5_9EURO|nr:uncharacterized protein BGW36DRAFT_399787 [Talaromyces proteolyticus]KAH8693028.1 hypothetical protein BGW36DRAFT_399787 [Talaromyces proteolyticus]